MVATADATFTSFVNSVDTPQRIEGDDVFQTLFREYERVVVTSLITSFGLEFVLGQAYKATGDKGLLFDQHGGDVDTLYTVRQIGVDDRMEYKNPANAVAYDNRGAYGSCSRVRGTRSLDDM